jgi:hypothetical protein
VKLYKVVAMVANDVTHILYILTGIMAVHEDVLHLSQDLDMPFA